MTENTSRARDFFMRLLFIFGIIVILIILLFAIVRFVPMMFSSLANVGSSITNIFDRDGDEIIVNVNNANLMTGEGFIVGWQYNNTETEGFYQISYSCVSGLNFNLRTNDGPKTLICNVPFNLGKNTKQVQLTPNFKIENSFADSTITIQYLSSENNDLVASGDVLVTVKNTSNTTPEDPVNNFPIDDKDDEDNEDEKDDKERPAEKPRPTTPRPSTNYQPLPDLNVFGPTTTSNGVLTFRVFNSGNQSTGTWYFTYTTPTSPTQTLTSPLQPSIGPGQTLAVTVQFSDIDRGTHLVTVSADPLNSLRESNENNNHLSFYLTSSGSNNNYFDYSNRADLTIDNIESGYITNSGRFRNDDTIDEDDEAGTRFEVRNRGGQPTGSWRFTVDLPGSADDFESSRQSSLRAGESRTITVNLGELGPRLYTITVKVDSGDDVNEERENNNEEDVRLRVR